jgi:hypothetical protein
MKPLKRFLYIASIWAAGAGVLVAQSKEEDIVGKYASSINVEDGRRHLSILAADWMRGRGTGDVGQKLAASYLADQFKMFGLAPAVKEEGGYSYFQKFDLEERAWKQVYITLHGERKEFLKDFYLYGDFDIPTETKSEIVFAGYGIDAPNYSDYQSKKGKKYHEDLKGKTVVIFPGEPQLNGKMLVSGTAQSSVWAHDWRKKAATARAQGADNVIIVVGNSDKDFYSRQDQLKQHLQEPSLAFTHKQRPGSALFVPPSMAASMLGITAEQLIRYRNERTQAIAAGKKVKQLKKTAPFTIKVEVDKKPVQTENVLGLIEGTDKKDEIIVLTAHYDHLGVEGDVIYNGADDDGSGTTALIEIAEAFGMAAREGYRPRRSILIMPVTAEEKGLMGSEYYTDRPVFPLANTVANLNIDMIGRLDAEHENDPDYVYIIGSNRLSSELHTISEEANKSSVNIKLDYRYNSFDDPNRFYYRSDHYNFAKNGIPVIFYFTGVHEDYHKPTDTVEKIHFEKMTKITRLIFHTAWELANRDERIVVDGQE